MVAKLPMWLSRAPLWPEGRRPSRTDGTDTRPADIVLSFDEAVKEFTYAATSWLPSSRYRLGFAGWVNGLPTDYERCLTKVINDATWNGIVDHFWDGSVYRLKDGEGYIAWRLRKSTLVD